MRQIVRALLFPVLALMLLGCTAGNVAVPREAVDIAAKIERTLASEQVAELSENLDAYLAEYAVRYAVGPRRSDDPLEIAESYLREHQPGPLPRVFQTTVVYDRNGVRLAEVFDEGKRTWVSLGDISPHLIDAVVATEDATFFTNPGIDARRVVGAFLQNAEAGEVVSGASTITMQLARLLFFPPQERFEQSMERKMFEALLAQELSALYTKNEILEMYLNLVHFGRLAYGIEAASQEFFAKSSAELTLAEATLLAGTPQKPGGYDLLEDIGPVKERQRVVLSLMVRHGYLTQADADAVFEEEPRLNYAALTPVNRAPHFVQYVSQEMNRRLDGLDISRAGLNVYTTLDVRLQNLAEQVVAEQVEILQPRFDLSNAALVALKPGTSEILVMVGSADFDDLSISGQVNVAVSPRQPGSAIKPILYATAIDDNLISPATVIWDVEAAYKLNNTEDYRPVNYDKEFHGPVTVRSALANSYNVPAVKLLDAVGVERMLEKAREMGIRSLNRDLSWYGLSLTLGGGEVTLLDLTDAFHTLANKGRHVRPQAIQYVTGELARDFGIATNLPGNQVLRESTAYLITNILSDNAARTPEFGENSPLRLSRPAAAKTGTTNDYRDNWTVGYTRYLVVGVWAGNSDGRPMVNASGVTGAAPIWNAFMEAVFDEAELTAALRMPEDDAAWEFPVPETVEQQSIVCPRGFRCPESEYFSAEWIELMEDRKPLMDSVVGGSMRTVYANLGRGSRALGACSDTQGESRSLLRIPSGIGAALPWHSEANAERIAADSEYAKRMAAERSLALAWSGRNQQPLYIGACSRAEAEVRRLYGSSVVAVSVGGYTDAVVQEPQPDGPSIESPGGGSYLAAATPPPARASSSYNLMGVAHDKNCGGDFVLGQVSNANGMAVSGVRVLYRDQFGNRLETVTSGQMPGMGSFRFAINDSTPQNISVSLLDANGAVISPTASVPHMQGGPTDLGCHYVIWQGVD